MTNIEIKKIENILFAELIYKNNNVDISKFDYAFYLYSDGEIIDRKWYSENNNVQFDITEKTGVFHIRCFIRNLDILEVKGYNSRKITHNAKPYNIKSWNKDIIRINLRKFKKKKNIEDAIYQFDYKGKTVDFLFEGFNRFKQEKGILVCFSGAITDRVNKYAPFFSGLSIAQKLETPLIAVADPSLAISNQLALSWYAGNEGMQDLPEFIAKILDIVSKKLDTRLTIFGGSGGGFAALSISQKIISPTNVVVWNPQTSIEKYLKPSVINYLNICFSSPDVESNIYDRLNNKGITHDLLSTYKNTKKKFNTLYLQNTGDEMHFKSHAKPLIELLGAGQVDDSSYVTNSGITFWLKHWGTGHLVPSEEIILKSLTGMLNNSTSEKIAYSLN